MKTITLNRSDISLKVINNIKGLVSVVYKATTIVIIVKA